MAMGREGCPHRAVGRYRVACPYRAVQVAALTTRPSRPARRNRRSTNCATETAVSLPVRNAARGAVPADVTTVTAHPMLYCFANTAPFFPSGVHARLGGR